MADLDVQIAAGAYLGRGGGAKNALAGMVLDNTNTIYVPYIRSLSSPATYKHCLGYSQDWGSSWNETVLEDFGSSAYPCTQAGIQCHINEAGKKLFVVAGHYNLSNSTLGITLYHRDNTGVWNSVTVLDHTRTLWSASNSYIRSYYRRGSSSAEDEIVIFWTEYPATDGYYPMYMRVWNSTSGLGSEIDVDAATGITPYGFSGDYGCFSLVPHPSTYEPIVSFVCQINTRLALATYQRNTNGTWTSLGDLTDINFGVYTPTLYSRRAAESGYVLDLYHQYQTYTNTMRRARHALGGGSFSTPTTGHTYTYPYYGASFSMKNGGVPGNEEYDRYMIYSRGTNIYCQLPPHTTPSTDYELVPIESSARVKRALLTMYYPGPDADTRYPHMRFDDKYAFAYERDISVSPYSEIRFFARDGVVWNNWDVPFPIYLTQQRITQHIRLGMTPLVNSVEFDEYGGTLFPTLGSTNYYAYQKIQFRNDLYAKKQLDLVYTSSVGTPTIVIGSAGDTILDAMGYTYTSNTISIPAIAVGDSAYVWVRWQPPAGYDTAPVGAVTHRIARTIR